MIDLREQVEELVIEGAIRPAGTEEEQNAALAMEERFLMLGLDTSVDEFSCQGSLPLTKVLSCAFGFLAGLFGLLFANGALLCIIFAALSLLLFLAESAGITVLDQLVGRGISQNVVGRYIPDDDEYHRLVVVLAHYDTARPEPQGAPLLAGKHALTKWILMGALLLILICGVVLMLGLPLLVNTIVKIVGAVVGIVPLIALIFVFIRTIMPYSESANDNTSGMAVMLGVADQLVANGGNMRPATSRSSRRREESESNIGATGDILGVGAAKTMGIAIDEDGNPDWRGISTRVRKRGEGAAAQAEEAIEEQFGFGSVDRDIPPEEMTWADRIAANRQASLEAKERGEGESIGEGVVQYGMQVNDDRVMSRSVFQETVVQELPEEQPVAEEPAEEPSKSALPSWWTSTAKKREANPEEGEIKGRSKFADLPSDTEESQPEEDQTQAPAQEAETPEELADVAAIVDAVDVVQEGETLQTTGMTTAFVQDAAATPAAAAIDPEDTYVPAASVEDISSRLEYLKANPLANLHRSEESSPTETAAAPSGPVVDPELDAIIFSVEAEEAGLDLDTEAALRALESEETLSAVAEVLQDGDGLSASLPSFGSADAGAGGDGQFGYGNEYGYSSESGYGSEYDEESAADAAARQRLVDLPIIGGFGFDGLVGQQAGFDDTAYQEGDFEENYFDDSLLSGTGTFQSLGATMAFSALDDSAFADVAEDELYIQDADDSAFDPAAGYNDFVPAEADMPKSRRSLFGRKRKDRKGRDKGYDQSASEWLDLEEDFDARQAGADIGSWENFGDDTNQWQGGAYGGDSFEEDASFIRAASDDLMDKEVWFVALGSSHLDHAGTKALFSRYGNELKDATFINVECVGAGDLCFIESEGKLLKKKTSETALQIADGVCENLDVDIPFESLKWLTTDAYEATKRGIPALTIMGLTEKNMPVAWHWKTDSRDIIDEQTLQDAADILMEALKLS